MRSVLDLPHAYAKLSPAARKRFDSLLTFSLDEGRLVVPERMEAWARKQFGSVAAVERQPILRVTNRAVYEETLFNALRAKRPLHAGASPDRKELLAAAAKEPFRDVEGLTPEDLFGRVYGRSELSASNVAKYDALHGLIIFNRADPLTFTEEETVDHFEAALSWIAAAHEHEPKARFPVIGWNCLWKAGASLVHGHLQVLLGKEPYAIERLWRDATIRYEEARSRGYWKELFKTHASLGLGATKEGVQAFASLTPRKEKEIILLAKRAEGPLFRAIYRVLDAYRKMGVSSFNVACILPPIGSEGFDTIVRIVDRGPLESRTTDIGLTELFLNTAVIASDPVKVWAAVKKRL